MTTPAGSVVVGVDGSGSAHDAFDWGAEQAALEHRPLVLAHAVPQLRSPDPSLSGFAGVDLGAMVRRLHDDATSLLHDLDLVARDRHPGLEVHPVLSHDDARTTLLDLSEHATMVVVGSRGRGPVAGLLLGSVGTAVSMHASCPVVVCRRADPPLPRYGVLVGIDTTARSQPVLELAYRVAAARGLPLTVLHLWGDGRSRDEVEVATSVETMSHQHPEVHVAVRRARGNPEPHLVAASHNYDLVVVGHQVETRLGDLVHHSVAATVVEHAHGPVAVVSMRPCDPGHETGANR